MAIELANLVSPFASENWRQSETAYYLTHVPWVGPFAYLHVIYKPASQLVLESASERLRIPVVFRDFLTVQNGASLFSGALTIFGAVHPGQLLNRSEPLALP